MGTTDAVPSRPNLHSSNPLRPRPRAALATGLGRARPNGRQPNERRARGAVSRYAHAFLTFAWLPMIELKDIDLRTDPAAQRYVKDEIVTVEFALASGALMSLEGANRYEPGDALITGTGGARWVVERTRFDEKYVSADTGLAHGEAGRYRNRPAVVLAKRMDAPFSMARRAAGDVLTGMAGDWVLQYAPGDYGVVRADRFAQVYRAAEPG